MARPHWIYSASALPLAVLAFATAACGGGDVSNASEFNCAVALPAGSPKVDTVSHFIHTDQQVPFRGTFRMEAPKCTRFNLHFEDNSWAAGLNCEDPPPPTHRRRPLKVMGRDRRVKLLNACCPHNKPCYVGGADTTGADFLLGVRTDGTLATTVKEFAELCPYENISGAIDLPDSLFERDTYPPFEGIHFDRATPGSASISAQSGFSRRTNANP